MNRLPRIDQVGHLLLALKRALQRRKRRPESDLRLDKLPLPARGLVPPFDPLDIAAWDRFWTNVVQLQMYVPPLCEMYCRDALLVKAMNRAGMRSVLCAGNGVSQEPRALAEAGFQVVALDFSPRAAELARTVRLPDDYTEYVCGPGSRRPGGQVDFVVGDILDVAVCPGPFDVIIERNTASDYDRHNFGVVLGALAKRLDQNGIFLSYSRSVTRRFPARPRHYAKAWFKKRGFRLWNGAPGPKPAGRMAWLEMPSDEEPPNQREVEERFHSYMRLWALVSAFNEGQQSSGPDQT